MHSGQWNVSRSYVWYSQLALTLPKKHHSLSLFCSWGMMMSQAEGPAVPESPLAGEAPNQECPSWTSQGQKANLYLY